MTAADVRALLLAHRFRFAREAELQDAIAAVLHDAGVPFERECRLGAGEIIDFLLEGGLGLEVKVGGGLSEVTRQLHRYAGRPAVRSLLLVTTRSVHTLVPPLLAGKPVEVLVLRGGLW